MSFGQIERLPEFKSQHVSPRDIDIWLPEGYPEQRPYAVVYMHDGQMLFDAKQTWNQQEWQVDEKATLVMREKRARPFVVVSIPNAGVHRHSEYYPQAAFESLSRAQQRRQYALARGSAKAVKPVYSDDYLRFLVDELKPAIDRRFATSRKARDTALIGASMGGLISWYGLAKYPEVFGAAGCVSTHWPGSRPNGDQAPGRAMLVTFEKLLPQSSAGHRLWFDHGTETLDRFYAPWQQQADDILRAKGYSAANWNSQVFQGAAHDEISWAQRLDQIFAMLLPYQAPPKP